MSETVKPSVLDDAEFHAAAESVLREGETVADLIDRSARRRWSIGGNRRSSLHEVWPLLRRQNAPVSGTRRKMSYR